jgi:hypothetical protein
MSMPIQRQSEQFSAFDSGPRWERDRTSNDLPKGLAALINTTGPRIQAGLLNTRQAAKEFHWQAHDDEFYPEVEGYSSPGARMLQKRLRDSQGNRPEPEPVDWDSIAPPKPKPRHARQAGYPSDGPRDHGGAGPDGGPSVPDWYYDDDNDNDGDPPDKNFVSENPWGHHASRRPFDRAAGGRLAAPTDWSGVRPGPLVDGPMREQDPDDYFGWRPYSGPTCETCGRPTKSVSGPHCRHAQLSYEDVMAHIDEQLATGEQDHYQDIPHSGLIMPNLPRNKRPGQYDPDEERRFREEEEAFNAAGFSEDDNVFADEPDRPPTLRELFGSRTAAVLFPPCPNCGQVKGFEPYPWARGMMWCNDRSCQHVIPAKDLAHHFNNMMLQHDLDLATLPETDHPTLGKHGRLAQAPAPVDPAQMQVPMGGGYQPAHRVGLPWRGQIIPGTVINLDGPNVAVRWDDGQYSTEEPHNIQLL